jgi:DNA-binding NarL/FixJ family response regulator
MGEPAGPVVLVVDDERFFREAICDALREAGFACRAVASAEEALASAADPAVAVMVLDLGLPDSDGPLLLRRLRELRPALRVIVLATHADQEDVLEALRLDASDYLAKPLHDEELVLAVRRALATWSLQARLSALRERLRAAVARSAALMQQAAKPGEDRAARLGAEAASALAELVGASKTSLMLVDDAGEQLRVVAATGASLPPDRMDTALVGESVAGEVFASGQPLALADIDSDARFSSRIRRPRYRSSSLALVAVPGEGGNLGVLCATDREGGAAFGEDELALMQILAHQLGALLAAPPAAPEPPAEAPQPAVDASAESDLELARAICDVLAVEVEPQRLVEAALRPVARALPAAPVSLYLIDNASGELRLEGQHDELGRGDRKSLSRQRGLTALVLQTGRVVATDRPQSDPRFDPDIDTPENGVVGPLLCVPLQWRGKTLGVARAFPQGGAAASARTGEVISTALSAAVRNLLLYRSLLESIEDLAEARREARGTNTP